MASYGKIAETAGGFLLIVLTLLDVFMTVLYARLGKGILSKRLARGIWRAIDGPARHFDALRMRILPVAGPLILIAVIVSWAMLLVVGFALVIHPALGNNITANSAPSPTDFMTAIYVAGDSMSTVGTSDLAPRRHRLTGYGMAVLYMFTTALHSGLLGALTTLARRSWYSAYDDTQSWHLTPLEDQHLGGLIMWIPAGVVYIVAGLLFVVGWMRESDRRVQSWESKHTSVVHSG